MTGTVPPPGRAGGPFEARADDGGEAGSGEMTKKMMTDPIADMLTRIRNAYGVGHEEVEMPASRLKTRIAEVLKREGFITDFARYDDRRQGTLRIYLKWGPRGETLINGLRRVSKPGCRVYVDVDKIPVVRNGLGVAILTTPEGVLSDREARKRRVGGEVLCTVW